MFIELNLVTDKTRQNTRRILVNVASIMSIEPEYSEPAIGSMIRLTSGDPEMGLVVEEPYHTIMTMLGHENVVQKKEL